MQSTDELTGILVERLSHLEGILANSLLGFLVTTTLSVLAAIYVLKNDEGKTPLPAHGILVGIAVLYSLLSGYYYFMLAHFYATVATVIPLVDSTSVPVKIENLWTFFQAPIPLDADTRNFVGLVVAPLYPLTFSWVVLTGTYHYLRRELPSRRSYFIGMGLQLLVMVWVITVPFLRFTDAIGVT